MSILLLVLTLAACCLIARADVRIPHVVADVMVLQRNQTIPVWGWANPGERITVQFRTQKKTTVTGKDGSPATVASYSATAYFFARELYRRLHIPVGIINTSWGGSMVETWISRKSFEGSSEFASMMNGKDPCIGLF